MLQNSGIKKKTIMIAQKSFLPLGWLFVNRKMLLPMSLVRVSIFIEGFLEKTRIKHMPGVLVTCGRKSSNRSKQKQSAT
jgi:hypothetical protein